MPEPEIKSLEDLRQSIRQRASKQAIQTAKALIGPIREKLPGDVLFDGDHRPAGVLLNAIEIELVENETERLIKELEEQFFRQFSASPASLRLTQLS